MGWHGCIIHRRRIYSDCHGMARLVERQIRVVKHTKARGRTDWEMPKGAWDKKDSDSLATAQRESREEAGIHLTLGPNYLRDVLSVDDEGFPCSRDEAKWFVVEFDEALDSEGKPEQWWAHKAKWVSVQEATDILRKDHSKVVRNLEFDDNITLVSKYYNGGVMKFDDGSPRPPSHSPPERLLKKKGTIGSPQLASEAPPELPRNGAWRDSNHRNTSTSIGSLTELLKYGNIAESYGIVGAVRRAAVKCGPAQDRSRASETPEARRELRKLRERRRESVSKSTLLQTLVDD